MPATHPFGLNVPAGASGGAAAENRCCGAFATSALFIVELPCLGHMCHMSSTGARRAFKSAGQKKLKKSIFSEILIFPFKNLKSQIENPSSRVLHSNASLASAAAATNKIPRLWRLHHLIAFQFFYKPDRDLSRLCHLLLCHTLLCHAGCAARLAIQIGCMRGSRGHRRCSYHSSGRSIISISHGID